MTDLTKDAVLALVYEAMRFLIWAAGEGISPVEGEPAGEPETILYEYSLRTADEAWDTLPDRIRSLIAPLLDIAGEEELRKAVVAALGDPRDMVWTRDNVADRLLPLISARIAQARAEEREAPDGARIGVNVLRAQLANMRKRPDLNDDQRAGYLWAIERLEQVALAGEVLRARKEQADVE